MVPLKMNFYIPTKVMFGCGIASKLPELSQVAGKRCLLLKYPFFNRPDLIDAVKKSASLLIDPDRFEENPTASFISDIAAIVEENAIDTIIGVGGGSTLDSAKAVVDVLYAKTGKFRDIIAVPTTSGTGSEVTQFAMITDNASGNKTNTSKSGVFPTVALCDPELTVSMPAKVTADSGIDALIHSVEAYFTTGCTGVIEDCALESCRRIQKYLRTAINEPGNIEARTQVMMGALEGGIALSCCGTVVVHAMAYEPAKQLKISHGLSNAMLFSEFFELFLERGHERAKRIDEIFEGRLREFVDACMSGAHKLSLSEELIESTVALGVNKLNALGNPGSGLPDSIVPLTKDDLYRIVRNSSVG